MPVDLSFLHLVEPGDALRSLREWARRERQGAHLTQAELAGRANVPATTISRFERTGLASTDAVFRILFALRALDPVQDFLTERLRLAAFPASLSEPERDRPIRRVRHKKGEAP